MVIPLPPLNKPSTPITPLPPAPVPNILVDKEPIKASQPSVDKGLLDVTPSKTALLEQEISIESHDSIYNQVIRSTLKPIHATDPNILRFIANYTVSRDVRQAARESGISVIDGKHLISYPDIYECVQKIAAMNARKYGYDAEEIVAKVKEVVDFDPVDLFNPETGGFYEDLNQIPPETRRVIKKLNVMNVYEKDANGVITGVSGKILKFEFWDKLKAAEMLGGEKDIFKKQVKVEHDVGVNMRDTLIGRLKDADERRALMAREVTDE